MSIYIRRQKARVTRQAVEVGRLGEQKGGRAPQTTNYINFRNARRHSLWLPLSGIA